MFSKNLILAVVWYGLSFLWSPLVLVFWIYLILGMKDSIVAYEKKRNGKDE